MPPAPPRRDSGLVKSSIGKKEKPKKEVKTSQDDSDSAPKQEDDAQTIAETQPEDALMEDDVLFPPVTPYVWSTCPKDPDFRICGDLRLHHTNSWLTKDYEDIRRGPALEEQDEINKMLEIQKQASADADILAKKEGPISMADMLHGMRACLASADWMSPLQGMVRVAVNSEIQATVTTTVKSVVSSEISAKMALVDTRMEQLTSMVAQAQQAANSAQQAAEEAKSNSTVALAKSLSAAASATGSAASTVASTAHSEGGWTSVSRQSPTKKRKSDNEWDQNDDPDKGTSTLQNGKILVVNGVVRIVIGGLSKEYKKAECIEKLGEFLDAAVLHTASITSEEEGKDKSTTDALDMICKTNNRADWLIQTRNARSNHGFIRLNEANRKNLTAVLMIVSHINKYARHKRSSDPDHAHGKMFASPEKPAAERRKMGSLTAMTEALKKIIPVAEHSKLETLYSKSKIFWKDDDLCWVKNADGDMKINYGTVQFLAEDISPPGDSVAAKKVKDEIILALKSASS